MVGTAAFEQPLQSLKEEIDSLEVKIVGCADEMNSLREYKDKFFELKLKRKELQKIKRDKLNKLKIMSDFFKSATGQEPDGIYPLFAQTNERSN